MMTAYHLLEFNIIQKSFTFEIITHNIIIQERDNKKVLPFTLYKQRLIIIPLWSQINKQSTVSLIHDFFSVHLLPLYV